MLWKEKKLMLCSKSSTISRLFLPVSAGNVLKLCHSWPLKLVKSAPPSSKSGLHSWLNLICFPLVWVRKMHKTILLCDQWLRVFKMCMCWYRVNCLSIAIKPSHFLCFVQLLHYINVSICYGTFIKSLSKTVLYCLLVPFEVVFSILQAFLLPGNWKLQIGVVESASFEPSLFKWRHESLNLSW